MNQDKIWEYFQNDADGLRRFEVAVPRYRYVYQRLSKHGRILNIGVGSGGLEAFLIAAGCSVYSLDPSEKSISSLRSRLGMSAEQARVGYAQSLPFEAGSFDTIVMSEVLEHLSDEVLSATIAEVSRVLKSGGQFIGTVPADECLLEQTSVCPHCGQVFHRWGHVQSFSRDRIVRLLSSHFARPTVNRVIFGIGKQLNWKGKLGWALKRIAITLGIEGSGESFYFAATSR
jgi:SAM-dependent methyltransferase